ncbi:PREDICTED: NAC domain-containing protein 35-like [Nicotiana attenuata]|uniref:Nac domain-containing protein 35 n=1 Tax=Nicotiana attenuata TaxID=49451 RepID=A0A314LGA1_NICAT|nr:PREDICTED: NAC domain-containing protein 35-like [Nicotiana attenuata]OIT40725.1 nac domain-containing protein 35 [Nicotiana attenuata]
MAIAPFTSMSQSQQQQDESSSNNRDHDHDHDADDEHEHDMVMPGFRFHPTEEELVEFYLRRKVEGKRFNVELITFLDLYRYDPWELPAMAAIGEKEWFFYVPRDRKYRNGDRPNRVTTSGYWKATGADRMIRNESCRPIGLKKTLVFYSGKAPKGIRSSWIMNEYRLPHHETERLQKAEISLCRVYKRPGVEDHPSLPRSLPTTRASSSSSRAHHSIIKKHHHPQVVQDYRLLSPNYVGQSNSQQIDEKLNENSTASSTSTDHHHHRHVGTSLRLSSHQITALTTSTITPFSSLISPNNTAVVDDLHRLVNFQNLHNHHQHFQNLSNHNIPAASIATHQFSTLLQPQLAPQQPQPNLLLQGSLQPSAFSERLWDWNSVQTDASCKDYQPNNPFN